MSLNPGDSHIDMVYVYVIPSNKTRNKSHRPILTSGQLKLDYGWKMTRLLILTCRVFLHTLISWHQGGLLHCSSGARPQCGQGWIQFILYIFIGHQIIWSGVKPCVTWPTSHFCSILKKSLQMQDKNSRKSKYLLREMFKIHLSHTLICFPSTSCNFWLIFETFSHKRFNIFFSLSNPKL